MIGLADRHFASAPDLGIHSSIMVTVTISGHTLHLEVQGWDKLWALKSRLAIPLGNIRAIRADREVARGWWKGFRLPGTHIPGVIVAGSYYHRGQWTFWDVHDPDQAMVLDLVGERYDRVVVEVEHPTAVVARVEAALRGRRTGGKAVGAP